MAISATPRPTNLFFLLTLLYITALTLCPPMAAADFDLLSDLLTLQSQSPTGVIRLNDALVTRFLASNPPYPFSLIIFFDALHLHSQPQLQLKQLLSEFALVSSSFLRNNKSPQNPSNLFFCYLEYKQSQSSFAQFGINSLPHILLIDFKGETHNMDAGDSTQLAESMAVIVILAALSILAPYIVKKVISGETPLHDPRFWLAGAVFVYFFSVSGAMHNIIRNMPFSIIDRNNPSKTIFFYRGSGAQLGAEGFAVGFLYTIVGLMLGFATHILVKVKNVGVQRVGMLIVPVVSFWAVKQVVFLDNWKTGYRVWMYWPSSWK
ncbi:hypothetical protein NMG60_11001248 [Bertholletia excelsa]